MLKKNLYKLVLDATWDWEYLSDSIDKKILYMTPSALGHTGYEAEEFEQSFELLEKIVHPEDRVAWQNHISSHTNIKGHSTHSDLQYRIVTKSGETKWISHTCVPFYTNDGRYLGRRVSNRDITEQKKVEDTLYDKRKKYQDAILENIAEIVWFKNSDGTLLACSPSFEKFMGKTSDELIGCNVDKLEPYSKITEELKSIIPTVAECKSAVCVQTKMIYLDGASIWVNITMNPIFDNNDRLVGTLSVARDITEAKENKQITDARSRLHKFALTHTLNELLTQTLNEMEALSESQIGFYHFLEEDQDMLYLQAWSSRTLNDFCHADGAGTHYNTDAAGVWVDCIRERKAIIHNDYASLPNKKGLPEGHVPIIRQMLIPIFRGDKIVSIVGIGNKQSPYTDKDLMIAMKFADLAWDIAVQKKKEEDLNLLAHFDSLTLLPNRVMLADRLQLAISRSKRIGDLVAICVLDLDGFKPINDKYGHKAGDRVLQEIGNRLQICLRGDDTAARLGGDEFVLVLGGLKNTQECEVILNRVIEELSKPIELKDACAKVGASIGVTIFPLDSEDKDTLLRHADMAMYQAKESGKNRYCFFDHAHEQKMRANQIALKKIKNGVDSGEFCLYYQPKVDCRIGEVVGMEALVRWRHPILGTLSPSQFLPLIEHEDLIVELGNFVIKEALRQMRVWYLAGINIPISVNIAARHLRRADFFDSLCAILDKHNYSDGHIKLEIEIVETAALEDITVISSLIEKSAPLGISYSLDDFGTGYSSLTHLKNLHANTLKIDQTFVIGMLENTSDLAIAEGIVALAHAFDRKVVAEGAENIEHILLLLEIGCDIMQGYALAKPMPANKVEDWIKSFTPDPRWSIASSYRPTKSDFHLLLAEANLRHWSSNIISIADTLQANPNLTNLPPQMKPTECRFGLWYYGEGEKKYSEIEEFKIAGSLHLNLHSAAERLLEVASLSDINATIGAKREFGVILANMTNTIQKLRRIALKLNIKHNKRK